MHCQEGVGGSPEADSVVVVGHLAGCSCYELLTELAVLPKDAYV